MNKSEKKPIKLHIIIPFLVAISILGTLGLFYSDEILSSLGVLPYSGNTQDTIPTSSESESIPNLRDTYTLEVAPYPSYLKMCELEFVDPPAKRSREQAIARLEELAPFYPAMYIILENQDKYSNGTLISVAANPEITRFTYEHLSSDGSVTGGISEEERPQDYPLFLQWDERWGYSSYGDSTMATSGCGPCSLSMAIYYLTGDKSVTPDAVAKYSIENNHYVPNVGTAWALLNTYPKQFGLTVGSLATSETTFKNHLDEGRILICSVRPGNFTYSGHFIVIYGYDETGFKINDPKCVYRSRMTWTYDQIKNDIKHTWSIGH